MKKAYIQKDFRYDKLQLIETVDDIITEQFPEGWKTHKHAETEVHNYAE